MASIMFGGGITAAVGSHGGNTFARNAAGAHVRSRTKGVNPVSSTQTIRRATLNRHVSAWTYTLTGAQRAAWRAFAATYPVVNRLGQQITLSGQQMFVKLNCNITISGHTPITTPPVSTFINPLLSLTLDIQHNPAGHLIITTTAAAVAGNEDAMIFLTPPLSPGKAFVSSQLKFFSIVTANTTTGDLQGQYVNAFGQLPVAAGGQIFGRAFMRNHATGILSAGIQSALIVT